MSEIYTSISLFYILYSITIDENQLDQWITQMWLILVYNRFALPDVGGIFNSKNTSKENGKFKKDVQTKERPKVQIYFKD